MGNGEERLYCLLPIAYCLLPIAIFLIKIEGVKVK
jgi:hypothetical protein